MSVSTTFIHCPSGQWTQIAQLRPERNALWVSCLESNCILSPSTAGPVVTSALGTVPAGYPHQPDGGPVPAITRIDAPNDLVTQQWWVWPIGASATPLAPIPAGGGVAGDCTSPLSGIGGFFDPLTGSGVLTVWLIEKTADSLVVQDGDLNILTPFLSSTQVVVGNFLSCVKYYLYDPSATAQAYYTTTNDARVVDAMYDLTWVASVSADGSATGNGLPVTVTVPLAAQDLFCLASFVAASNTAVTVLWDAPTVAIVSNTFTDPDGNAWWRVTGYRLSPTGATVSAVSSATDPVDDWSAILSTVALSSGSSAVTITVSESFASPALDDPDYVDATATIAVQLPKLSRGAVAALHDLLARFKDKEV